MFKTKKGFTLVELLIVISIIAVLTLLGATNWIAQQQKARDARRKADLEQIRSALEMYRTDKATYPIGNQTVLPAALDPKSVDPSSTEPTYISPIPKDPKTKLAYTYVSISPGATYTLTAGGMEKEIPYIVYNP